MKIAPTYIAIVQQQSGSQLPPYMQNILPASLHLLVVQYNVYFSD